MRPYVQVSVACARLLGYTLGYRQFHELLRKQGIRGGISRLQRLLRRNGFIGIGVRSTALRSFRAVWPS